MGAEYPTDAEYNKLVRDKIPAIIEADGLTVETKKLSPEEVIDLLKQKGVEEATELSEAVEIEDIKKEMSDVLQVLQSLSEKLGIEMDEIENLRLKRAEKRGAFNDGVFLVRTYKKETE